MQLGILRGLLVRNEGESVSHLDPKCKEGLNLDTILALPGVVQIKDRLQSNITDDDLIAFVEGFIVAVEASTNPDVLLLVEAATALENTNTLPHPIGIGVIAVELFGSSLK